MPKLSPVAELSDRLLSELTACRLAGGESYPVTLDKLVVRLDPAPDKAIFDKTIKSKGFAEKAIVAIKGLENSPVVLLEDIATLAASPLTLEAVLFKGGTGKPPWLLEKLANTLDERLRPAFIANVSSLAASGQLPSFAVAFPKGETFTLCLREQALAAEKLAAEVKAAKDADKAHKTAAKMEAKAAAKAAKMETEQAAKAAEKAAKEAEKAAEKDKKDEAKKAAKAAKAAEKAEKVAAIKEAKAAEKAKKDAEKAEQVAAAKAAKATAKAEKATAAQAAKAAAKAAKEAEKAAKAAEAKLKPDADAAKLVDALRNLKPLATLTNLEESAGLGSDEMSKAVKSPVFAEAVVQGKHDTLGQLVALKDHIAGLAMAILPQLIAENVQANAHAFAAKDLAVKVGKPLGTLIEAVLEKDDVVRNLPTGIGFISIGGKQPKRHYFRIADVRSASAKAEHHPAHTHSPVPDASSGFDFASAFDAAFARLDREQGSNNFVSLVDLRAALPAVSRSEFDAGLRQLRIDRRYSLKSDERSDALTPEQKDAAIREEGELLLHVSKGRL